MRVNILSLGTLALYSGIVLAADSLDYSDEVPQITTNSTEGDENYIAPYFPLMGFEPFEDNPIMRPNPEYEWESTYLYNPTTIVIDDKIWMLYRAQNEDKVSVIGLAWSEDGYNFTRYTQPVMTPTEEFELPGGCEDPRVIRVNGTFYMTYTGYDGSTARLAIATSTDLVHWEKHGLILPDVNDALYVWNTHKNTYKPRTGWSKAGSILNEKMPDGKYLMLYGDSQLYAARSEDLIHWEYKRDSLPYANKVNDWEQSLMESGPPPLKTRDGKWMQIYNGVAIGPGGYKPTQYSTGELLFDPVENPNGPATSRLEVPLLQPETLDEVEGQVDLVVFTEGLVQYHGKWFMYFGQGDTSLGVAVANVQPADAIDA